MQTGLREHLTVLPSGPLPADQVTGLVALGRERGGVTMADIAAAVNRSDLPPDAVDGVLRLLADQGVEILDTPDEDADELPRGEDAELGRRASPGDLVRIYLRER